MLNSDNQLMSRRDVLRATAAGVALMSTGSMPLLGQDAAKEPLFKISLAEWSLHNTLFGKKLAHEDFAPSTKKDYGIDAVEFVNIFMKDQAKDEAYLKLVKKKADDAGVKILLIMCDGEGALGDADDAKRTKAVENHYKWVDAAKFFGCHSIRVNAQSSGERADQEKLAADGLRRLTEFAAKQEINVIVENHGGLSSHGDWLAAVMKRVGHPRCGTLPDFGNFYEYDRYQGVTDLMPFAKAVSAKSHAFDDKGNETKTDYRRMMKIVLDAGYRGYVGIEYEGKPLPEPDGVRATQKLLETVRAELSKT